jgi:hypothetical protein
MKSIKDSIKTLVDNNFKHVSVYQRNNDTILKTLNTGVHNSANMRVFPEVEKVEVTSIVKPINSISVEQVQPSQEPVQKRISAYVKRLEEIVLTADMQGTSYDDAKDAINAMLEDDD